MFSMKCCRRVLLLDYPNIATAMKALQLQCNNKQQKYLVPTASGLYKNKITHLVLHRGVLDRMLSIKA